jgi:Saxitoxin biosynthesis operon protein SxtJ
MNATSVSTTGRREVLAVSGGEARGDAKADASNRELRNFGFVIGGLLVAVFGLLIPLLHRRPLPWWPWAPATLLVMAALIRPSLLHYFYLGWSRLGFVLGWLNTRLILGCLFYVVITPVGVLARIFGRLMSGTVGMRPPGTYRVQSHEITRESFEKPF